VIDLKNKELRHGLLAKRIPQFIAIQVRLMRQDRGWTIAETAKRCGVSMMTISRIEDVKHNLTISTLIKIAAGFDVALIVKFASWSELVITPLGWTINDYCPKPFTDDEEFRVMTR